MTNTYPWQFSAHFGDEYERKNIENERKNKFINEITNLFSFAFKCCYFIICRNEK